MHLPFDFAPRKTSELWGTRSFVGWTESNRQNTHATRCGYMFIFLKREPGMAHTSIMIKDQNQGT
jgi:hypothetical protein